MDVIKKLFRYTIRWPIEAAVFYGLAGVLMILPVSIASALGGGLMRMIAPLTPFHRRSLFNIGLAMPELSPQDRQKIALGMWAHLGRVLGEYLHTKTLVKSHRITYDGLEHLAPLKEKGGFMITAHLGNWELVVAPALAVDLPVNVVFRRINNPLISKLLMRRVQVFDAVFQKGLEGARGMASTVKSGKTFVALVDQKLREGEMLDFFGHKASTAVAHIKLAEKFKTPIVTVQIIRTKGCHFHIVIRPLDLSAFDPKDVDYVNQAGTYINGVLEGWIRENPEQWMWPHRRWPASKGEVYIPPQNDPTSE